MLRELFGSLLLAGQAATDIGYYLPSGQLDALDRFVLIGDA